ncbi:hypothetical protein ACQEVB_37935 [Pseudonocardia sp. CA-107938]|uniref:hypothetical protein n=1 Tax=Pseudonocardia sp. CA-107938 TaxID=3240021 RepID=UPI003D927604
MTPLAVAPSRTTGLVAPALVVLVGWNVLLAVLAFGQATAPRSDGRATAWTLFALAAASLLAVVAAGAGAWLATRGDGGLAIALTGLRVQCCLAFLHLVPAGATVGAAAGIGAAAVMVGGWALLPRVTAELTEAAARWRR